MAKSQYRIWEKYPELVKAVNDSHAKANLRGFGHDIYHAIRVAQMAARVSKKSWQDLAAIAGLCHNADRVLKSEPAPAQSRDLDSQIKLISSWLLHTNLTEADKKNISDAVIHHDRKNQKDDHPVLIALQNADRLINLELDVAIRGGQFHPEIIAVDPRWYLSDPKATYAHPRSVFWDEGNSLRWLKRDNPYAIRGRKARRLGRSHGRKLKRYIKDVEEFWAKAGLCPEPKFLKEIIK